MIYVDGAPFSGTSNSSQESNLLDALLDHPFLVSSANSFRNTSEINVYEEFGLESSTHSKCVYVFQREYATVDPTLVDIVGTDESTTCTGLVIRNRQTRMTSVAHMDFPTVVKLGLAQMLSRLVTSPDDILDVHLVGGFQDASPKDNDRKYASTNQSRMDGYSFPLCAKLVETLVNSPHHFHLQTLFVMRHNTSWDSEGNAHPIFKGVLVKTSTGSVFPAVFDRASRCPDEIVRRVRASACYEDPSWNGKLLETYDTDTDRFTIAPSKWTRYQLHVARELQFLSDSEILLKCSTSPADEPRDFVENERRKWEYIIQHPDWSEAFPGNRPRIFTRRSANTWARRKRTLGTVCGIL